MKSSIILSLGIALLCTFAGCDLFNPADPDDQFTAQDGNAETASLELSDMGDAVMEFWKGNTTRSSTQDTVDIDITIVPWSYDATVKGWIRKAELNAEGGSITRNDTVWFYDANNAEVVVPTLAAVSYYRHVRTVVGTAQNTFTYRYEMNVTIEKGATDTVFVFNGSLLGEFNGETIDNTVITNVKRHLIHLPFRWLSVPFEGTISIDRPFRTAYIVFGGEQTALVTVTRKSDGKTWVFTINIIT